MFYRNKNAGVHLDSESARCFQSKQFKHVI